MIGKVIQHWRHNLKIDQFTEGYLEGALAYENDDEVSSDWPAGRSLSFRFNIEDFAQEAVEKAKTDCERFQRENEGALAHALSDNRNGQLFWLTRNRHGTGFWDQGLEEAGEMLRDAAHKFGECSVYVGDDGKLHLS